MNTKVFFTQKLNFKTLVRYQPLDIKRAETPNNIETKIPFDISTVMDLIVQRLFAQLIEPVIEPYSDVNSYGFRRGRNAHQAVGEVARLLYNKPSMKINKSANAFSCSRRIKYIVQLDICNLFDKDSHK